MRKTVHKRILAIVLALCMMLTLMPSALAASAKDFTDVSSTAWYYGSVDYVAEHGYFNGTGVGKFSPDASMTRGMFVTVLARVDGAEVTDGVSPFEDVPSGMWYAGEVAWAVENGVVLGIGGNRFAPERPVSRQEMTAFIARYLKYYMEKHNVTFQASGPAPAFQDADKIAAYAVEDVELCRSYGLVNGDEKGRFNPESLATRAEAAAVIHRLALLLKTGQENPSGGGGGGGGDTSATTSASTAAAFIEAAQKDASTVTASVEPDNSITVNDDIVITNNSVRTLTLELNNASVGNLTVNSASAIRINLKGTTASVSSLTVNAPRATVTNEVTVDGSVEIRAVSSSTFNNTGGIKGNITVTGPGAVNDTQENPVPVLIVTQARVLIRGNSREISIQADGANLTLSTDITGTGIFPTISSTADNVKLLITGEKKTIISGTVNTITTTSSSSSLNIEGTVDRLNTGSSGSLELAGGGLVKTLSARNTNINIPTENKALSIGSAELAGGSLTAPNGTVDTVKAGGRVELNTSVNQTETQPNTTLKLGENKTVNTLTANGSLTLNSTGTAAAVGQIDVASKSGSTIKIQGGVAVSAVNNTGSGQVTLDGDGKKDLAVTEKAAPPATVGFAAPAEAGGKGTITGVNGTMEYRDTGDWTAITGESVLVDAGTYQVRVKATDTKLASEAVTVTVPAAVAVKEAAIQGSPYVGQTLTAVANADATGTLSYVWKAGGETIPDASGKTFTLTDAQIGKAVTVSMSNYSGKGAVTSAPTAAVTVDKTALNKLLAKAAEVQQGVAVKDQAPSEVAEGIVFVTTAESNALTGAVAAANAVAQQDAAKTADVTGQEAALRKAIEAYVAAKKTGTLNEAEILKSELGTLISAATAAKVEKQDTDAANVEPNAPWVTAGVNSAYATAISTAEAVKNKSGATAAELAKAITDLNAAMLTYQKAIRKGAALDNTALLAAINAAELNAASVSVSSDGKDVLPSQSWVTEQVKTAYNTAITAAKNTPAAKQSDNTAALAALNEATDTFNEAKAPGTKDIVPPIVTGVSAEKKEGNEGVYVISFTSNEAGAYSCQAGSTEGEWPVGTGFTKVNEAITFDYTPTAPGAMLYIQVSDQSGNASVVQVKVGEEPETAEASIGSAKYATFEQALAAATSGQTVKLLKDVETEQILTINKSLTLDTNGKTLKRVGELVMDRDTRIFAITGGATTLTGGGTLTINDCRDFKEESSSSMLMVDKDAKLVVGDVTIKTGYNVMFAVALFGGEAVVNDGAEIICSYGNHLGTAISTNGSDNYSPATITVNGGVITGGATGLYLPGKSQQVTIGGGKITGGIEVKGGTVNVTGGEIIVSGVEPTSHVSNSNGTSTEGYAVALVENSGYQKDGTAVSLTITGGTITGKVAKEIDSERTGEEILSITGGTFSEDPGAYVARDYKASKNADNTYTVAVKTEPDENDVASVGGRFFTTLQDAFDAAQDGETVALLQEINFNNSNGITIAAGKNVVLDLSGKTVEGSGSYTVMCKGTLEIIDNVGQGLIENTKESSGTGIVVLGGTLNLKEGTVRCNNYRAITVDGGGTLNMTGGTATGKYGVRANGVESGKTTAAISGGTVIGTEQAVYVQSNVVYNNDTKKNVEVTISDTADVHTENTNPGSCAVTIRGNGAILNVTGGTITSDQSAIAGNGTVKVPSDNSGTNYGKTVINISGGVIKSTGGCPAVYHPQSGTLCITGGELSGHGGIQLCSGEGTIVDISGNPSVAATGADGRGGKTGDGYVPDGAAVSVVNRNYPGGMPQMSISGGTFTSENSEAVLAYTWSNNQTSDWTDANQYLSITGGTFSKNPSAYVAKDYKASENADGTYTVAVKTEPDENDVASVGGKYFRTLQGAFDAAQDGETIELCSNVMLSQEVTVTKSVTLELNGKTIDGTGFAARAFTVNAPGKTVTVQDSSTEKMGKVNSNNGSFKVAAGTLNIGAEGKFGGNYNNTVQNWGGIKATGENVTINVWDAKIESTAGGCFAIEGGTGDVLNIYGGTFTQQTYFDFVSCCVGFGSSAAINISGGEFTCTGGQSVLSGWNSGATVTVTGGIFKAVGETTKAFQVDPVPASVTPDAITGDAPYQAPNWKVSGGTFTGPIEVGTTVNEALPTSVGITGGTFSTNPSAYVAEGYKAEQADSGNWTVKAVNPAA